MLRAAQLPFDVRVSGVDEAGLMQGTPRAIALKTALAKATEVSLSLDKGVYVLAADTMVVMEERIFNKPENRDEARRMLQTLSGRTHCVLTSVALLRTGGEALIDVARAEVTFNPLSEPLIEAYLASGEADDKAGAYGIQGLGANFVACVEGDLTCVIGLPLGRLREMYLEISGHDLFAGQSLLAVALKAFPDLALLPPQCLGGIPG